MPTPLKRIASVPDSFVGPGSPEFDERLFKAIEGGARPESGQIARPAAVAQAWEDLAEEFRDLIEPKVDLVDELEQILRGNYDESDEVRSVSDAPVAVSQPQATDRAEDDWQTSPGSDATEAGFAAAADDARSHWLIEEEEAPVPAFWSVDERASTATQFRDRRRPPRSDVFIISALALLIAGGGAFSAFHDWSGGTAAASDEVALADGSPAVSRADAGLASPIVRNETAGPVAPRTVAVVPVPAGAIPATPLAEDPAPALALEAPPPAAPGEQVPTTPQPIDLLAAQGGPFVPVQDAPVVADLAAPAAEAAPAAGVPADPTTTTAETWVNMRAGPDNGAAIVRVISPNEAVTVTSCDLWCEVVVEGQAGYVFHTFLAGR